MVGYSRLMGEDEAGTLARLKSLRKELVRPKITGGRQAIEKYVSESIPMGRWASIEEIAESSFFLTSDRSSFMTGHALVVDSGECIA